MPNPKRRHSQARTSKRRSHDHLTAQSLSECPNCHERKLPHRACPKCGYYKGREVIEIEERPARLACRTFLCELFLRCARSASRRRRRNGIASWVSRLRKFATDRQACRPSSLLTPWAPTARPNPKSKAPSSPHGTMTWKSCWSGKEDVIRGELDLHRFWRRLPISIVNAAKSSACRRKPRRRCAASATRPCASDFAWCATARPRALSPPAIPARPWPPPRWCWARSRASTGRRWLLFFPPRKARRRS